MIGVAENRIQKAKGAVYDHEEEKDLEQEKVLKIFASLNLKY